MAEKESKYKEFYSNFGKYAEEIREKTLLGDFWGKCGIVSYQKQLVNPFKAYRRWHKIYKYNSASIFQSNYFPCLPVHIMQPLVMHLLGPKSEFIFQSILVLASVEMFARG